MLLLSHDKIIKNKSGDFILKGIRKKFLNEKHIIKIIFRNNHFGYANL